MSKPTANFDGNDFASSVPGLIVVSTDPYRTPTRALVNNALASANKSVNSSAYFVGKAIRVQVEIGRDTRELLEAAIDTLEQICQTENGTLIVVEAGSNRLYTATLESITPTDINGGWAALDVTFRLGDPYGYDSGQTSLGSSRRTGTPQTNTFPIGGTAKWQLPVITITFNALTGGTSKNVVVGNSATGQQITVNRTWTALDVLVIDSQNKKVTVNGAEVAFTGAFPEYNVGSQSLDYSDTLTTRDVTIATAYTKRYL